MSPKAKRQRGEDVQETPSGNSSSQSVGSSGSDVLRSGHEGPGTSSNVLSSGSQSHSETMNASINNGSTPLPLSQDGQQGYSLGKEYSGNDVAAVAAAAAAAAVSAVSAKAGSHNITTAQYGFSNLPHSHYHPMLHTATNFTGYPNPASSVLTHDTKGLVGSSNNATNDASHHSSPNSSLPSAKPAVGSDEWARQRKENHKKVEKRRREAINEGINELSRLIPDGEKNKGLVLQRAVSYIQQLRDELSSNTEKWTLEKLLCEQAIGELSSQVDRLKTENSSLRDQVTSLQNQLEESNKKKK